MILTSILLLSGGIAIHFGLPPSTVEVAINPEVQALANTLNESIQQVQAQLTTNLDEVFYALQKPCAYMVGVVNTTTGIPIATMQNGATGALTYFNSNASKVLNFVEGNLTHNQPDTVFVYGNFTLTAPMYVYNNTDLIFVGQWNRAFNGGYLIDTSNTTENQNICIEGYGIGFLYGNNSGGFTGGGIRLQAARWCTVHGVLVYNFTNDGIDLVALSAFQNYLNHIEDCDVEYNGLYQMTCNMTDCWFQANYGDGTPATSSYAVMYCNSSGDHFISNHFVSSGNNTGIWLANAGDTDIEGGELENCQYGIVAVSCTMTTVTGVQFHFNKQDAIYISACASTTVSTSLFIANGIGPAGYSDVVLDGASYNSVIEGNQFAANNTGIRSAIRETGGNNNTFQGNSIIPALYSNGPSAVIERLGTDDLIRNNIGFVTEVWISNSTATDGGKQPLGLAGAATEIFITSGNTTAIECGYTSVTAYGFVYSLKGLAGTGQSGQTVSVYAVYQP